MEHMEAQERIETAEGPGSAAAPDTQIPIIMPVLTETIRNIISKAAM